MRKIYRILTQSDVYLKGNNTTFSLYPSDMIICEEIENNIKIVALKFKMASVGFKNNPSDFHTLNLKVESDSILRCPSHSTQWRSINFLLNINIIEDITISYQRDEKIGHIIDC